MAYDLPRDSAGAPGPSLTSFSDWNTFVQEDTACLERRGPTNGQLLMVLSTEAASFNLEVSQEKLKTWGIQVPTEEYKNLIENAILDPQVRRFIFYNSRPFQLAIAVVFYIAMWANLYSTSQMFSLGRHWAAVVLVTLGTVLATVILILIFDRHQRKSVLRHRLNQYQVVVEMVVNPAQEEGEENERLTEEAPLLPAGGMEPQKAVVMGMELHHLIPEAAPEVMARQMLVVFGGLYIRLMVTNQLPETTVASRHAESLQGPCPCQFIETHILGVGHCSPLAR
ncbi:transmembrane protein 268 isoform X3 [Sminthopsis crassicaudata]|uniref:transmembrane protein 268 isoform X3 n=1 Tax=Sminthopsis crassicaudata TaxID=9301 RepID=UPI003D6871F6